MVYIWLRHLMQCSISQSAEKPCITVYNITVLLLSFLFNYVMSAFTVHSMWVCYPRCVLSGQRVQMTERWREHVADACMLNSTAHARICVRAVTALTWKYTCHLSVQRLPRRMLLSAPYPPLLIFWKNDRALFVSKLSLPAWALQPVENL